MSHLLVRVADLGDIAVIGPALTAAAATLIANRRRREAVAWLLAFVVCTVVVALLKASLGGFAITILGVEIHAAAFPSGHAALSVVFYDGLAVLLWRGSRAPLARLAAAALALLQAMIVMSVFLLAWHPVVDMIAGLLLGAACLGAAQWRALPKPASLGELAGLAAAATIVVLALRGERLDDKKLIDQLLNRTPIESSLATGAG